MEYQNSISDLEEVMTMLPGFQWATTLVGESNMQRIKILRSEPKKTERTKIFGSDV